MRSVNLTDLQSAGHAPVERAGLHLLSCSAFSTATPVMSLLLVGSSCVILSKIDLTWSSNWRTGWCRGRGGEGRGREEGGRREGGGEGGEEGEGGREGRKEHGEVDSPVLVY